MKNNYKKIGQSYQETLTNDDIQILLEGYDEVNNVLELKPGLQIRYYLLENDKKMFRMGGNIIKVDFIKNYIVLTNGKINWSVQLDKSIIYKKMTIEEVKKFYEEELDNKDMEIEKYKKYIISLKEKYNKLYLNYQKKINI